MMSANIMAQGIRRTQYSDGPPPNPSVPLRIGLLLVCAFTLLCARPSAAWRQSLYFYPRPYLGQWQSFPWAVVPSAPLAPRPAVPPGAPYSYRDPADGATYCLSESTGWYFVCSYSSAPQAAYPYPGEPVEIMGQLSAVQSSPPASGIFVFKLAPGTDAAIDGVPIGLSEGLGVTAVAPGQHQIRVEAGEQKVEYIVVVKPHGMFTITPTAVIPTEP